MTPPNVAHAIEYMALRRRFFSEPVDVAERHMLDLGQWAVRARRSFAETVHAATTSLLAVDAANAKWGPQ